MALASLLKPPRRTSDDATNLLNIFDWLGDLHTAIVLDANLLNPAFSPLVVVDFSVEGSETAFSYAFASVRADTDYLVIVQPEASTGAPPDGAVSVKSIARTVAGFTVTFASAPGADCTVTGRALVFAT